MRIALALFACLVLTFAASTIVAPGKAYACSCAATPSVEEELNRKTAVFSGTVTKVVRPDKEVIDSSADLVEVTFEVEKVWKGDLGKQTKIYTAIGSESCGYENFEQGDRYIVSAYGSPERLETGICELTKPIDQVGDVLEKLGAGLEPNKSGGQRIGDGASIWPWAVSIIALGGVIALFVIRNRAKDKGGE